MDFAGASKVQVGRKAGLTGLYGDVRGLLEGGEICPSRRIVWLCRKKKTLERGKHRTTKRKSGEP